MRRSLAVRSLLALLLMAGAAGRGSVASGGPFDGVSPRPWYAAEIEAFLTSDSASPPSPCAILFTGSSSIRLWETLAADMAPVRVINRGFGGSTIADVDENFGRIVAPYRPRAIFFYAGENDVDLGRPAVRIYEDFRRFMALKDASLGTTPVYFISLKPSKLRFAQRVRQAEVNQRVARLARNRADLHFIDVVPAMLKKGQPRDIYRSDGLHMTQAGYRIWTRLIRPAVLSESRRRTPFCSKE